MQDDSFRNKGVFFSKNYGKIGCIMEVIYAYNETKGLFKKSSSGDKACSSNWKRRLKR